ncbi:MULTISPECIES: DUF3311 domain-containing protein [Streptomyces]|nr:MULTISPECIES: DUF3311 domain-containing protein [unclassified Streptomyces]SEC16570.1 Protein of unknown function [Streptomyces sp. PAN_FS17]SED71847.1 Protein of unknown function [Streptomyces sp. KS_5]
MARTGQHRLRHVAIAVLLLAPAAGLLWVPWYAGAEPRLAGTPFFYWYQLAWVPGCGLCLLAAYALTDRSRRRRLHRHRRRHR